MKKILVFLFLLLPEIVLGEKKMTEKVYQGESFQKALLQYGLKSIEGRLIFSEIISTHKEYYVYSNKIEEALSLALKLTSDSIDHGLDKDELNIIFTNQGQIILLWFKRRWNLEFNTSILDLPAVDSAKMFSLKRNLK